jgi:hypothetical protein
MEMSKPKAKPVVASSIKSQKSLLGSIVKRKADTKDEPPSQSKVAKSEDKDSISEAQSTASSASPTKPTSNSLQVIGVYQGLYNDYSSDSDSR